MTFKIPDWMASALVGLLALGVALLAHLLTENHTDWIAVAIWFYYHINREEDGGRKDRRCPECGSPGVARAAGPERTCLVCGTQYREEGGLD